MLREATSADIATLDAFLEKHSETSMFLRSNLAHHGVGWTDAAHSTRYFIWDDEGRTAVFGLSKNGFLMAQAEDAGPAVFNAFAASLQGQTVQGMTGAVSSVSQTLNALGLESTTFSLQRDEPLYARGLADLTSTSTLRRARADDAETLLEWFAHYEIDAGVSDPEKAKGNAPRMVECATHPESAVRLMVDADDTPLAMASINAAVSDVVQVGGVFVPRKARNGGLARQVTAGRLAEARDDGGARKAILFASGAAAARAYEAIGFQRIGTYRIALLAKPQQIGAAR